MADDGRAVTLPSSSFRVAPQCCSCGAPQQTQVQTAFSQKRGRVTTTIRLMFPYCSACATRVAKFKTKHTLASVVALGLALVIGGLVFAVSSLSLVVALVIATVVGIGGALGAAIALRPPLPAAPATGRGESARITGLAANGAVTIHFTNPMWADAFAAGNGVGGRPKSRGDRFLAAPIVLAVIFAPAAGIGAWEFAHPPCYVDNPTADALQIFVDGSKVAVVGPNSHAEIDVGHGKHTFGAAKSGASAPASTTQGEVEVNDAFLYNPNKSGCYWLVADAYGSARTDGITQGPQPIKEFYHFNHVDNWFSSNPQSIQVDHGAGGGTRIALQRSASCMQLVERNCSLTVREAFVSCQRTAKSEEADAACTTTAVAACGGATPAPAPTAPPSKPASVAPTPAPKPAPVPRKPH